MEANRQVHLDFHTSEHISGIGERFSRAQWQQALQAGHVAQINVFAKCHHGWCYYPTRVGKTHPYLGFDLLGAQIEASHAVGVRAPVYVTVGWSARDAIEHPEWRVRRADGSAVVRWWGPEDETAHGAEDAMPICTWDLLCPSGGYHELVLGHTEELCRGYEVDGFWYDIYTPGVPCWCEACRKGMRDAGLDADREADARAWRARSIRRHAEALRALILGYHPDASVYFNGLTNIGDRATLEHRVFEVNTKQDLEDLPTTWGGYDKLPLRAKYFHRMGRPIVAMSGKFHTTWGEFGGFKHPDAIRIEAAMMTAYGVHCNFGDQLHPGGEMDVGTYANIGAAYEYVESIEQYGLGGVPYSTLGLRITGDAEADEGAARMLLEMHRDFVVIEAADPLDGLDTVVVPSVACIETAEAEKIAAFLDRGGKVLALGAAATAPDGGGLALEIGPDAPCPGRFDVDYTVAGRHVAGDLPPTPFLNYQAGLRVTPGEGVEVLARVREPYFSRTYGMYCGHQNTPYRLEDAAHPAVVRRGGLIWCAHALDRMYLKDGARVHRQLFANALGLLHTAPVAETDLPSAGRMSVLRQADRRRWVVHLVYAPPLQRGRCLVIDDIPVLRGVQVLVRPPIPSRCISLEPAGVRLRARPARDGMAVTVPELRGHAALVFEEDRVADL